MDYRQDLIILLEPKEAFRPEIDSLKNSNGIRDNKETKITWEKGEYEKTKIVHLPFDSRFLLIFARKDQLNHQKILAVHQLSLIHI